MSEDKLSRDDLFLLMQSYKNTIEMNSTLLHQQETLIDQQSALLNNSKEIVKKLEELTKDVIGHKDDITKSNTEVTKSVSNQRVESGKEHSNVNVKLYGIIGTLLFLLGSVIIAIYTRSKGNTVIIEILGKIAEAVGVK